MKFTCAYPWGSTYSNKLMSFLDVMEIPWVQDPRRAGSDCWGLLISTSQEALDLCVTDIQKRFKEVEEFEAAWEKASSDEERDQLRSSLDGFPEDHVWEADKKDVVEVSTDWKHLEIDDHGEKLRNVGVSMTYEYVENDEGKKDIIVTIRPL